MGGGNSLSTSVLHAKTFFEKNYSPEAKTRTAQHAPLQAMLSGMDVVPDWEYAVFSENEVESYIEVPLISNEKLGAGPPEAADESEILQTDRRLVVRQIKETGELYLYTSLWIPDDEESLIAMPSLNMFDKGLFSGRIYFFLPDGLFYWGAVFELGEAVALSTVLEEDDVVSSTRAMECVTYSNGIWRISCTYLDYPNDPNCGEWYYQHLYNSMECYNVDTGGVPPPNLPPIPSGSGGGGGSGDGGGPEPTNPDSDSLQVQQAIDSLRLQLTNSINTWLANANNHYNVTVVSSLPNGNMAEFSHPRSYYYSSSTSLTLKLLDGFNETQQKLILAHEILGHLTLIDIMRQAGSLAALENINKELYDLIVGNNNDINKAHHLYWATHIELFEQMFRNAFPGESEDFYEYGKWGGGFWDSPEFDGLPGNQKRHTRRYLRGNDLF